MTKKGVLLLIVIAVILIAPVAFFYITTLAVSTPQSITVNVPKDDASSENKTSIDSDKPSTVHLILYEENIYQYKGTRMSEGAFVDYDQLQSSITGEKSRLKESITVMIKPSKQASYQSIVNTLDQMTINNIASFTMRDPSPSEINFIQKIKSRK